MYRKLVYSCMLFVSIITIGVISPSVTEAANSLDTFKNERQLLLTEQNKVSQQLKDEQSKLNALLNDNKAISLDTQKKRAELDALQTKLTAQRKQISTLNQQIKDYRKNNQAISKGTKAQKAKYTKELTVLQAKYKKIQTKATSLKNEVTRIDQNYTNIKNKLNRNRTDITATRKVLTLIKESSGKITTAILTVNNKIAVEEAATSNNSNNLGINEQPSATNESVSTNEPYLYDSDNLTEDEKELARLINEYRKSLGLDPLPISKSLTTVARTHVNDSNQYSAENGVDVRGVNCNLHSWSANGTWSPVCYTGDHEYSGKMWNKPKELTSYQGSGFEISVYSSGVISPARALAAWKGSPGHNDVIIGSGPWSNLTVMGVGINGGYAHVWYGEEADPAGYYK